MAKLTPAEIKTLADAVVLLANTTQKERDTVLNHIEKNLMPEGLTGDAWKEAWLKIGDMKLSFDKLSAVFPPVRKPSDRKIKTELDG